MITIRELTSKCSVHNTPLASKPVDGTKGQSIGRLYWCPLCDKKKETTRVQFTHGVVSSAYGHLRDMTPAELKSTTAPVRRQER